MGALNLVIRSKCISGENRTYPEVPTDREMLAKKKFVRRRANPPIVKWYRSLAGSTLAVKTGQILKTWFCALTS